MLTLKASRFPNGREFVIALITPPTAQEVFNEAGHDDDAGLSAEHFGKASAAEVLALIDNEILPTVVRTINGQADEAAYPFDFPLSEDVWRGARKTFDDAQIQQEIDNQEGGYRDAIRLEAASRLLGRVVTTNEFWVQRAERLKAQADESLLSANLATQNVVKRTVEAQAEGRSGFGIVTINTEPKFHTDEFGIPRGIYGY